MAHLSKRKPSHARKTEPLAKHWGVTQWAIFSFFMLLSIASGIKILSFFGRNGQDTSDNLTTPYAPTDNASLTPYFSEHITFHPAKSRLSLFQDASLAPSYIKQTLGLTAKAEKRSDVVAAFMRLATRNTNTPLSIAIYEKPEDYPLCKAPTGFGKDHVTAAMYVQKPVNSLVMCGEEALKPSGMANQPELVIAHELIHAGDFTVTPPLSERKEVRKALDTCTKRYNDAYAAVQAPHPNPEQKKFIDIISAHQEPSPLNKRRISVTVSHTEKNFYLQLYTSGQAIPIADFCKMVGSSPQDEAKIRDAMGSTVRVSAVEKEKIHFTSADPIQSFMMQERYVSESLVDYPPQELYSERLAYTLANRCPAVTERICKEFVQKMSEILNTTLSSAPRDWAAKVTSSQKSMEL